MIFRRMPTLYRWICRSWRVQLYLSHKYSNSGMKDRLDRLFAVQRNGCRAGGPPPSKPIKFIKKFSKCCLPVTLSFAAMPESADDLTFCSVSEEAPDDRDAISSSASPSLSSITSVGGMFSLSSSSSSRIFASSTLGSTPISGEIL